MNEAASDILPHGTFPKSFRFGSATSAYQIEGAVAEDGRGQSIWDAFSHASGKTTDGLNGDIACDHYHRWPDDIALMRSLNLEAYRFSVAWPRILPKGWGRVNAAGLDFYDRLVDGLLAAGIAPYATLYHWDLPLALQDKGGWVNRDTPKAFADYAGIVAQRLGDRVASWATLNEPRCQAIVGNQDGRHAPGLNDRRTALQVAHHLLLGHGLAIPVLRQETKGSPLGIVLDIKPYYPAAERNDDRQVAKAADGFFNRWFFDPVCLGRYPADAWEALGDLVPEVQPGDLEAIKAPIDHIGLNYYTRGVVTRDGAKAWPHAVEIRQEQSVYTAMNWEVAPQALEDMLVRLHADYPGVPAFWMAENGAALDDAVAPDGRVHDPIRTGYYQSHIAAVARAMARGVPIDAYFAWSLMDNFEWGFGYTKRFGIVHVDYASQKRTPKDSALWYRDFIAAQHPR